MITESAVLGTPAIRLKTNVGNRVLWFFIELSNKYDLIYTYDDPKLVITKANELVKRPNLKKEWEYKKEILLNDKIDSASFMEWLIEEFPQSLNKCLSQKSI